LEATEVYFILHYDLLSVLQNLFGLFYRLIACWSSFSISWTRSLDMVTWQGLYHWMDFCSVS